MSPPPGGARRRASRDASGNALGGLSGGVSRAVSHDALPDASPDASHSPAGVATRPAARPLPAVVLRRPTPDDARPFLALVRRSRRLHAPWVEPPEGAEGYARYLARAAGEDLAPPTHRCRLVCRASDGAIVAVANLNDVLWGALRSAALGYYAFAPFAGQGYMRAGVVALLGEAFDRWGLHRVEAAIQPGNTRSRALVAALGFRLEGFSPRYLKIRGRWRDHERWAVLAEEWRADRARAGTRGRGVGA